MDPELEEKIGEIEKMAETQVNERLQAMLVSGGVSEHSCVGEWVVSVSTAERWQEAGSIVGGH